MSLTLFSPGDFIGLWFEVRRRGRTRTLRHSQRGRLVDDPSEAVHSESLRSVLRDHFSMLGKKGFGGNILHPLLKDIGHHFHSGGEETMAVLQKLFEAEDGFLATAESDFLFGVYQKPARA